MCLFWWFQVCVCLIYVLFNQIASQHAYNLGHAQVRRKDPQNQAHFNHHQHLNNDNDHLKHENAPKIHQADYFPSHNDPSNNLANKENQLDLRNDHVIFNLHPRNDPVYQRSHEMAIHPQFQPDHEYLNPHQRDDFNPQNQQVHYKADQLSDPAKYNIYIAPKPNEKNVHPDEFNDQPRPVKKIAGFRMQRGGYGGSRQTFKHFRYSRIRRYYTLSTGVMTTWKKINYTTRLMYTTPTTRTTYRYTQPANLGSSRQTVLHTRMTESDEIGKDLFMSGSIEYKDDSFDKPPTAMVAYDSLQVDSTRNATASSTVLPSATTVTKPITVVKSTKKISSELISLESSSEEKSSSSEAKDESSSSESEDYGNDKLYGEYGYHRKYNNTPNPFTIVTYANLREVPGFEEFNLTDAEVDFWQENASWIMDKYFPSSELELLSNYSEENLVRSFFHPENIEPHHLDFFKWYYKLLTNAERLRIVYNRTVLEEPDYRNLSQFTPFAIPDDLQRYYMFICQMENEINREKLQEERDINTQREAEQNLDRILGDGTAGGRAAGAPYKAARFTKKKGELDVSQILQMVDHRHSDSKMPGGGDSSEGFIDASRYKREISRFEPD